MTIKNRNIKSIVTGSVLTLVFLGLLLIRFGLFESQPSFSTPDPSLALTRPAETWMSIRQNNLNIGVLSRRFFAFETGYQTEEELTLHLNTLGVTQVLHLRTETFLDVDMRMTSFESEISSSLFRYSVRGAVAQDRLIVFAGLPGKQQRIDIPITRIPHLSGNLYEAAFLSGMAKDEEQKFSIFDPSTLGIRDIPIRRHADEVIPIMGRRTLTQKYCADVMGATHCAWLSSDGELLRESGMLGLSIEKVHPDRARDGLQAGDDIALLASIPSNKPINNPAALDRLTLAVSGIGRATVLLYGGRQNFDGQTLTITKENVPVPGDSPTPETMAYLKPSPLVQSDHARIRAAVNKIVSVNDTPREKLGKIVDWVYRNIDKKPVLSVPNALEVLQTRVGDCNEHAVLTAALLRAAGIPAQIETGLTYLDGRFYYHAWNRAFIGSWVTVDTVFNQIPADVTHIRLSRGEGPEQLDLLGVIGNIKLEVLSKSHD